jgi:RHS repeat-associated protein
MAETDASANWTNYIFFGGERLARNVSGDIKYYITDHLHSTAMFVDKAGTTAAILDDNDFYPWGGAVPGVGKTTSNNHYKMTGKERDTESGLDYYGARYYGSAMGRFMSPDWAAKPATVPYAEFGDPQSLNLYSYTRNSPIIRVDGDGHDANGMMARPGQGGILGSGALEDGDNPFADKDRVMWANEAGAIGIYHDVTVDSSSTAHIAQTQNTGQAQKEDRLTNVVYNETGSLSANSKAKPGADGSTEQLHQARVEVAEVAERVLESNHPGRVQADDTLSNQTFHDLAGGNKKVIAALKDSRSAAQSALSGSNRSNGAMHYRTSHHIINKLYGQKAEHFGPFRDALGGKTYIMVAP